MEKTLLQDWKFIQQDLSDAWMRAHDDSGWQAVTVPHDWSVSHPFSFSHSSGTGYLPGGTGWYRTSFLLSEADKGSKVFITFDGVYKNSQVFCNGTYLGKRPFGYASFTYDLSEFVSFGDKENVIAVKVAHEDIADSRWFTGSGIYRKVSLSLCPPIYVPEDELVFQGCPCEDGDSHVLAEGLVRNDTREAAPAQVTATLLDAFGHEALRITQSLTVPPMGECPFSLTDILRHARLWSPDTPNLYTLQVSLQSHGQTDTHVLSVGIRSIRFDPNHGFFLNGESLKIKGVCVHHDAGCLGAAVWPCVWQRRLAKLKAMGCNAIRMAHNPHMPELYDLCDQMGFLVMDEAFDEWEGCKNKWANGHNVYPPKHYGYYEDFPTWHKADLEMMVKRDRNHASVILWSVGNEVDYPNDPYVHPLFGEMTGNNDANKPAAERIYNENKPNMERLTVLSKRLSDIVRSLDTTRPVLCASAFPELSSRLGFFDAFDVIGYNYKEHLYEEDHKQFPTLPILGSENGHGLPEWQAVLDHEYIAGQFLWTGIDFLGETKRWPLRGSLCGLLTLAGFEKPGYYRRKCLWNSTPAAYLFTGLGEGELTAGYDYPPGQEIQVVCYTNLTEAELFQNECSLGKKQRGPHQDHLEWTIPFVRGKLHLMASDGQATAQAQLLSVLPAVQLALTCWDAAAAPLADTGAYRVHQVEISLLDENGQLCPSAEPMLSFHLDGAGRLLGIENGNQGDMDAYALPQRRAYQGKAIAYVLTPKTAESPTTVTVRAFGFPEVAIGLW